MSSKGVLQGKRVADSKSQDEDKDVQKKDKSTKNKLLKNASESYDVKNLKTDKYMQDSDKNRRESA